MLLRPRSIRTGRSIYGNRCDSLATRRALVIVLEGGASKAETALLSERALAADWDRAEEDEAWAHLQRDR